MSETHTAEPWEYEQNMLGDGRPAPGYRIDGNVDDEDESYIGEVSMPKDARRIVASVNACAGIPTEELESIARQLSPDAVSGVIEARAQARADEAIELLREALGEMEGALAGTENCGDPWAECPMQGAHKDYGMAGKVTKIRAFLERSAK